MSVVERRPAVSGALLELRGPVRVLAFVVAVPEHVVLKRKSVSLSEITRAWPNWLGLEGENDLRPPGKM